MPRTHKIWTRFARRAALVAVVAATGGVLAGALGCCGAPATPTSAAARHAVARRAARPVVLRLSRVRRGNPAVTVSGGRPTVLYFMSAQCGSCAAGEVELARLRPRWRTVRLVSVDVAPGYDRPAAILDLARAVGARWPQTYATSALLRRYHVTQLDQVVVLNRAGRVVYDGALPGPRALARWVHRASV